jgi:hypothetical protein
VFTRDGYRPHYNSGALIAGKKKMGSSTLQVETADG